MTYCVAMRLNAGLVFLSDSRTNAGVDHIGTFRKMSVFENPGDRMMVLMTAGNLSISQSIRQIVADYTSDEGLSIWTAKSMHDAARLVGEAIRNVHGRDAAALEKFGIDFNVSMIFGGQINGERCRLFQMYSAGNFIESHDENTYFQIGESKYGKPIIDRVISTATPLDEAAKCALISMDSTLRSNLTVGLPLELLVYRRNAYKIALHRRLTESDPYFRMIGESWSAALREAYRAIPRPDWAAE